MKTFVIFLTVLISQSLLGQSYDQTLKKCIQNFHDGLGKFSKDKAQTEVERRYAVLNECIRGQKFPAFRMATYNGEKYSSEENAGKVVLLNFWITKSPTSVAAIPYLNELAGEYKDKDFVILSFAADQLPPLETFLATHPVKYRVFGKTRDLINHQFNTVIGYPTNIILNKKGEVVEYRVGGGIVPEELLKTKGELKRIIEDELVR
jgi:thiol-disulfide isomerase/thioredoxin